MKILASLMQNFTFRLFWLAVLVFIMSVPAVNLADVPGRTSPRGTVPNPGVQQQELPNITFPAPYNVFEFVVTCIACHGGTIDQSAGHGGNWAGSNMASATRDPVFRANQLIVNNTIKNETGSNGAGNLCFRCHSPNGWLSGRMDPTLGGAADGSDTIHSIVLSTDDEGVSCEQCHRATGAVTMQRFDLNPAEPAWNMMAGPVGEWPHVGFPYPAGPGMDNPYGDATLQYHDGMSYGGRYGGNTEISFSDVPFAFPEGSLNYTGQTYGTYPYWYTGIITPPPPGMPNTNDLGEVLAWNVDGSLSFQFEGGVMPDPLWGAISPEHSTRASDFVMSPEFCGACHDVTVPMMNHGMPEQRTYTEWKYSAFGNGTSGLPDARCQGCHMPTKKHEYSDNAPVSINPDPLVSGWYPYARDRNIGGGTAFHKFAGANSVLPKMMKVLYPEIDLEVIGAPTGHDPMIFPGMLSDRGPMFDRAIRNTEISLRDAASVEITQAPTEISTGVYRVTVKVTNKAGHKIPSGYPDGRRMWISLMVDNNIGVPVYQSGYYDEASARLYTDTSMAGLDRALSPTIDASAGTNAVMIYEKKTGTDNGDGTYTMSFSLLNNAILFDNRIPPLGYDYDSAGPIGGAFWTYDPATLAPAEDPTRYPNDPAGGRQNWDEVTYTFTAPPGSILNARAELYHQTIPREFMEHLNDSLNALPVADRGPRPEGPPNILDPNYPLTPTYLSDSITTTTGAEFQTMTDLNGVPLQDHWGGVAYAAWLNTGKGAPYILAADDTAVAAPPAAPVNVVVTQPIDPVTTVTDPNAQTVSWNAVAGADGYLVWVRYGASELTSDWDKLAMTADLQLTTVAMNPGKTFAYKIQAFNAKGMSVESAVVEAPTAASQPLPPINLRVAGVTASTISLAWYDQADNETLFEIQRQDVPVDPTAPFPPFITVAVISSQTAGGAFGGNSWTDTGLLSGRTYNYQVRALNDAGPSAWTVPGASGTTLGPPIAPTNLLATIFNAFRIDLSWNDNSSDETGFRLERASNASFTSGLTTFPVAPNVTAFSDATTSPLTTYYYRVFAVNTGGDSLPSNVIGLTTPAAPPPAPTELTAVAINGTTVNLNWTDNATSESGFIIDRALDAAFTTGLATFTVGPNVTGFTDTTVEPKFTYYYRVKAFNTVGNSDNSNTATVLTPGEIPEAPAELRVILTSATSITLGWLDKSINEGGFHIERSTDGVNFSRIATTAANSTRYRDGGLTRRTTYWYRVQAFNADGVSAYTNVIQATTR